MAPTGQMKILSWNCRVLGGPSTIPQLKESIRLNLPEVLFICETKQSWNFAQTVCKNLRFGNIWDTVEPVGKSGGLLVAWKEEIQIRSIIKNDFCYEIQIQSDEDVKPLWLIFVYTSTESRERRTQWEYLIQRKQCWGSRWVMGGDFNDIKEHGEKNRGRRRSYGSFLTFRNFISRMEMGEVKYRGNPFTWANNRADEGFVQERLDRFFGSMQWMLQCDTAEVIHTARQSSDHALLILDTQPQR